MSELKHFGIPGQKWGIRRWQNADGSFNEEGKKRYGRIGNGIRRIRKTRLEKAYNAQTRDIADLRKHGYNTEADAVEKCRARIKSKLDDLSDVSAINLSPNQKKLLAVGAIATSAAIIGIGAYTISHRRGSDGKNIPYVKAETVKNPTDFIKKKDVRNAIDAHATEVLDDIKQRHSDAAKQINNTVNDILNAKTPKSTRFDSKLDEINSALEGLHDSARQAKAAGVSDDKILWGKKDIDNYFSGKGVPRLTGHLITRQEIDPEEFSPRNYMKRVWYGREFDNYENKIINALEKIKYPTKSPAYTEAIKRIARRENVELADVEELATQWRIANEVANEHPPIDVIERLTDKRKRRNASTSWIY